jgi:hypothetical protein
MERPPTVLMKVRAFARDRRESFALVLVLLLLQIPTFLTDNALTLSDVLRESGVLSDENANGAAGSAETGWDRAAIIIIALIIALFVFGLTKWLRRLTFVVAIYQTINLVSVTFALAFSLGLPNQTGRRLLQDSIVVWVSIALLFTLWYWLLDEAHDERAAVKQTQQDIVFAEAGVSAQETSVWRPRVLDYAYVAFTISTTLSPGSALMFSRRAKVLQMLHTGLTLILFLVIAARAINILQ